MLNLEQGRCGLWTALRYEKELHCTYERDILLLEDLQPSDESLQTQQVVSVGRDIDFIQHHLRGSFSFLIALFTADYVLLRCLKAHSINNWRQVPTALLWIHYKTAHSSGLFTAVYPKTDTETVTHNLVQLQAELEAKLVKFFISCKRWESQILKCAPL